MTQNVLKINNTMNYIYFKFSRLTSGDEGECSILCLVRSSVAKPLVAMNNDRNHEKHWVLFKNLDWRKTPTEIMDKLTNVEAVTARIMSEDPRSQNDAKLRDHMSQRDGFYRDRLVSIHRNLT